MKKRHDDSPILIVIAGPNGAGKSTVAPYILNSVYSVDEFVNADTISKGLSYFQPNQSIWQAGRLMLERLDELASKKVNFAFETTLASRSFAPWLTVQKESGYHVHLYYIWVPDVATALERVQERVKSGGHFVPDETVKRRYNTSIRNFFHLYHPLADYWEILNNKRSPFEKIAAGNTIEVIYGQQDWDCFQSYKTG